MQQYEAPINTEGLYDFKCKNGHLGVIVVDTGKFDVLASVAIQAIADGYYREAVASFAACLERFYEFYVRTILLTKQQEKGGSVDDMNKAVDEMWKPLKSLSERQLGAFVALYYCENNSAPSLLSEGGKK